MPRIEPGCVHDVAKEREGVGEIDATFTEDSVGVGKGQGGDAVQRSICETRGERGLAFGGAPGPADTHQRHALFVGGRVPVRRGREQQHITKPGVVHEGGAVCVGGQASLLAVAAETADDPFRASAVHGDLECIIERHDFVHTNRAWVLYGGGDVGNTKTYDDGHGVFVGLVGDDFSKDVFVERSIRAAVHTSDAQRFREVAIFDGAVYGAFPYDVCQMVGNLFHTGIGMDVKKGRKAK